MGKLTTSQKYRMGFRDVFHKYRKSKRCQKRGRQHSEPGIRNKMFYILVNLEQKQYFMLRVFHKK